MAIPLSQDMIDFLKTLILGEFQDNKQQSSIAILLRGLIGVIPGVDQVLDAQDTIALIVRFNQKNWQLSQDDYADLAFTAFGWIPELGSVFKGVLKPIWKQSKGNKGVQNGIRMLENALKGKQGAVISKIRSYVRNTAQWTQWANIAITECNIRLTAYIEMLQIILRGHINFKPVADWKWTHTQFNFPAWLIKMAREQIAPAQKLKQILAKAITEGVESIRYFLETLLGEHANLVMAAVNGAANHTNHNKNGRPHAVHNANQQVGNKRKHSEKNTSSTQSKETSNSKPYKNDNVRHDRHPKMTKGQNDDKLVQNTATNSGRRAVAVQKTKGAVEQISNKITGLIGEHMADYWMLEQVGGKARHDHGGTAEGSCYKMNFGGRLYQLHQPSANPKGIDSLWKVNGKIGGKPYCILEAKASATALTRPLGKLLTDGRDKTERRTQNNQHQVQMSHTWCESRLRNLGLNLQVRTDYSRRVVFFGINDIATHTKAYAKIVEAVAQPEKRQYLPRIMMEHTEHKPGRIFTDEDIEVWVKRRIGEKRTESSNKVGRRKKQKP